MHIYRFTFTYTYVRTPSFYEVHLYIECSFSIHSSSIIGGIDDLFFCHVSISMQLFSTPKPASIDLFFLSVVFYLHLYLYLYLYISLSLSLSLYIYQYLCYLNIFLYLHLYSVWISYNLELASPVNIYNVYLPLPFHICLYLPIPLPS